MGTQTIRQVSTDYGVSRRMLCYYEDVGLLESKRVDGYAYRVYDEAAIRRLQQVIILRKLHIPIKQIKSILVNQDAVELIEIFKQNINGLDERITAMATLKSILVRFVRELQEKTDVRLKLDILNDPSIFSLVDSLAVPISRIEEKMSMDELNKANETLDRLADRDVRVIYHPPAAIVEITYRGDVPKGNGRQRKLVEEMAERFIKETDLFRKYPEMRVFVYGEVDDQDNIWITVPQDFEVPPPYERKLYPGGLYASCTEDWVVGEWVERNKKYEWYNSNFKRAIGWEYFNPFNIYGLDETNPNIMYTMELYPIREKQKYVPGLVDTVERLTERYETMKKETFTVDLTKMEPFVLQKAEYDYDTSGSTAKLHTWRGENNGYVFMLSEQKFNMPLKIDLRAKTTDEKHFDIRFGGMKITLVYKTLKNKPQIELFEEECNGYDARSLRGAYITGEYMDIECWLTKTEIIAKINGELVYFTNGLKYIEKNRKNPDYTRHGVAFFGAASGSTVEVEYLRVTELDITETEEIIIPKLEPKIIVEHIKNDGFYYLGREYTEEWFKTAGNDVWDDFSDNNGWGMVTKNRNNPNYNCTVVNHYANGGKVYMAGTFVDEGTAVPDGFALKKFPPCEYLLVTHEWLGDWFLGEVEAAAKDVRIPDGYTRLEPGDGLVRLVEVENNDPKKGSRWENWIPIRKNSEV
jgi:DNA-binding transcriptional MerR regulator/predicted transcriptional regulator YdeE